MSPSCPAPVFTRCGSISFPDCFSRLLFGLSVAISACFVSWVMPRRREYHRGSAIGYLLLLASVAVILCASNAFLFLFSWELLTLSFYILTSVTRSSPRQTGAAWSTVGMGKFGGAALLLGFLMLAGRTGSLELASWHAVTPGALLDVTWVLVVVGFGAKLGVVPFQVWIPLGYPAAPGPARAAMAGVAANVGVYGLWRFLSILRGPPEWLVIGVLLCGGVTALLGITFAGVQSGLARVVAYSSIENAGLILTAYGLALTGSAIHSRTLIALGLLAATLQTCAHAVAKSALFVSLANVEAVEGSDDLDRLRGVGRRMPWSGATFGAGALALAGLPPTIGFASEWFILEALMQQFRVMDLPLRLGLAVAAALVALTTGLAALVFLRVLALDLPRQDSDHARTSPRAWHPQQGRIDDPSARVLAGCCVQSLGGSLHCERSHPHRAAGDHARGDEVAVGAPAGLRRIFDSFSFVALGHPADRHPGGLSCHVAVLARAISPNASRAALAIRDGGREGSVELHRVWICQSSSTRARQRSRHVEDGIAVRGGRGGLCRICEGVTRPDARGRGGAGRDIYISTRCDRPWFTWPGSPSACSRGVSMPMWPTCSWPCLPSWRWLRRFDERR